MRAYIKVDLNKLKDNYFIIQKIVPTKSIIAVIKGNAYGHGLIECARLFSKLHVSALAVATLEEALLIRKNLIFTPVLLFERSEDYHLLNRLKITTTVVSLSHLDELADSGFPLFIQIAFDTGLNRDGLKEEEADIAIEKVKKSHLILTGIYSHHTSAINASKEDEIFARIVTKFSIFKNLQIHTSSSNNIKNDAEFNNCIRVGAGLYGIDNINNSLPTKQALSLFAPIIRTAEIKKNNFASYSNSGVSQIDGYVYTLSIGYNDGLNRSSKLLAYYNNSYCPQLGNMMMDHTIFVGKEKISEKEGFELIGEHLKIDELAKLYHTVPHDIVASLSSRVKRIYE